MPDIACAKCWDMSANKALSMTSGKPKVWLGIQRINNDKNNVISNLIERGNRMRTKEREKKN